MLDDRLVTRKRWNIEFNYTTLMFSLFILPISSRYRLEKVLEIVHRKNEYNWRNRTISKRVGIHNRPQTEKWRCTEILCRLQKVQLTHLQGRLSNPSDGWMYRKIRRGNLFKTLYSNYGYCQMEIDYNDKEKSKFASYLDCMVLSKFRLVWVIRRWRFC